MLRFTPYTDSPFYKALDDTLKELIADGKISPNLAEKTRTVFNLSLGERLPLATQTEKKKQFYMQGNIKEFSYAKKKWVFMLDDLFVGNPYHLETATNVKLVAVDAEAYQQELDYYSRVGAGGMQQCQLTNTNLISYTPVNAPQPGTSGTKRGRKPRSTKPELNTRQKKTTKAKTTRTNTKRKSSTSKTSKRKRQESESDTDSDSAPDTPEQNSNQIPKAIPTTPHRYETRSKKK